MISLSGRGGNKGGGGGAKEWGSVGACDFSQWERGQ